MKIATGLAMVGLFAVSAPEVAASDRSHDGGFFLRLALGGGHANTEIEEGPDSLGFSGLSGTFDVAIGAVVARNFAVHGILGGFSMIDPEVDFNGFEEDTDDVSVTMTMYGGGVTYWFGDSNAYLTASAGAAELTLDLDGDEETSDTGFAAEIGLGKEWWVANKWGLGAQVSGTYHSIPPGDADENFKGMSFAVKFTATLN